MSMSARFCINERSLSYQRFSVYNFLLLRLRMDAYALNKKCGKQIASRIFSYVLLDNVIA